MKQVSALQRGFSTGFSLIMIEEHDRIVLAADLPGDGLQSGDVGVVVHIHRGGKAYEVEFVALDGQTMTVATLSADQVRPIARREIAHARKLG